ncbi:hypothetical protein MVEN_01075900 [Mycena venus]|uniref:Shugoshin N-terminal coiled-coil domain-containing protein n=1 Tax=Mycena venus TaxID=2733690 RepID=A0A8H6Y984_9AGAR|nr:hypothetical protein MVEN_01075900 [Mycena venus]
MSRRESRVSMNVRQNDALFEFENFKKKFLLANKHITKLNSTLSMKIEELNTEISTLYTENLRLRASEIALAAQLKREREKSRKNFVRRRSGALSSHFGFLRQTFNIPVQAPPSPTPTPPTPSHVSNINEDEEEPEDVQLSPPRKAKKKARLSASKLPLPARSSTPPMAPAAPTISVPAPAPAPPHLDFSAITLPSTKKRRQSGLLLDLGVVDIDTLDLDDGVDDVCENEWQKEREREKEKEKERKRRSRDDGATAAAATAKPKPKLKDVTNSNSSRPRTKTDPTLDAALTPLPLETQVQARTFLIAAPPKPAAPRTEGPARPSADRRLSADHRPSADRRCPAGPDAGEARVFRLVLLAGLCRRAACVRLLSHQRRRRVEEGSAGTGRALSPPRVLRPRLPPTKRARSSAAAAIPVHASASASVRRPSPPLRTSTRPAPPEELDEEEEEKGEEEGEGDEEDSDMWADGEYVPGWASGHVNVEGRRRAQHGHSGRRKAEVAAVAGEWAREREREGRRHSAVV